MPELERMMKRQQVLAAFGEFAIHSNDLDAVLMEACRLVGEATGTDRAKVLEIQEGRQELLVRAGVGWALGVVGKVRLQMGERSSETYAIEAARPVVSQDIAKDDRFDVPPFMKQAGVVALVNVPIFVPGQRPYGVLQIDDTRPREFGNDEIEFLRTYAMILGPVIDRLHLVEERARNRDVMRASEARNSLLVGSWAQAQWETDGNGVVVADSPSWRDHTGQTFEEWLGYGWLDAIHPDDRAYAEKQWREAIAAHGLVDAEFRLRAPDGGWRWTNVRAAPVLDAEGGLAKWVGMNIDIDPRKRAEAALRDSESKYRSLFESIDEGFCIVEVVFEENGKATDYIFLESNPVFEEQAGFKVAPGSRMRAIAPDHEQFWFDTYGRIAVTGEPARFEHRAAALGIIFDVYAFRIDEPERGRVAILFRDITSRKRTEEQLRALVLTGTASTYRMSPDWRLMFQLDSQTMAITDEPIENWVEKYIPDQDLPDVRAAIERAIRNKAPFELEHRVRLADGTVGWVLSKAVPLIDADGAIIEWFGTGSDVTERRAAVEQVRDSEERLRRFGEASQDVLWIRDVETFQWTYLTPAFDTTYGLDRKAALKGDDFQNWLDLIEPEDRAHAATSIRRVSAGEHVTFEYRIRRPSDGAIRWMRDTDFPITDTAGRIISIGGTGHDFTDVREAEERLKTLMEGIPQLVWRAVHGGEWTWASPQWAEYTGQTGSDSHGSGWLQTLHPDDRAAAVDAWGNAMGDGGFQVEYRICHFADDQYRWFQTRATPVRDSSGEIIEWLGTSTDVHDLRELHERQQVLVAELQHRTRNLLAVVRAVSDKTARASVDIPDFRSRFRDRIEALARVQGLLSRLHEHDRVTFDELINAELTAMDVSPGRVTLSGPGGIRLRSSTVQTLAMGLHELATNAVKYGALGQTAGHLDITWSLEEVGEGRKPWLHIDWRERGVEMPPVGSAPRGTGQGRELIEKALPHQLRAKTSYVFESDGVHCTISMPVSASTGDIKHAGAKP
ncbi:PAS domain-containing protein [Sphingomonas sp. RB3P16]|uniref:PAS domain-containing protein n=1 Tax=Parasphingomonas frigoris TaxID=3096163 RepID=UPI002FC8582B